MDEILKYLIKLKMKPIIYNINGLKAYLTQFIPVTYNQTVFIAKIRDKLQNWPWNNILHTIYIFTKIKEEIKR